MEVRCPPGVIGETEMLLNVQKMTCNHCIRSVTAAVHTIDPHAKVAVDLTSGTVQRQGGANLHTSATRTQ